MSFNAQDYLDAARERLAEAKHLYYSRRYGLSHYAAGLAVECLLRAYRFRRDPEFDSRHDLYVLIDASGMAGVIPKGQVFEAGVTLTAIARRWTNNHRFRSERALRRWLKRAGLDRGMKGDYLKENARRIIEAAEAFVELGIRSWQRS
jgi:HEPN domain-containing protein